ncbi:MAG: ABC transporter permease [Cyclobacteriaceae bacterium]|nr:ABC transporter permease [Cyclobacteriaceae bacterium]
MITILPIIQLLILVNAANFEIKNIKFAVLDNDKSQTSQQLIQKLEANTYFTLVANVVNETQAKQLLEKREVDMMLQIPSKFETDLQRNRNASLYMGVNAIDGSAAGLISYYANNVIVDYNIEFVVKQLQLPTTPKLPIRTEPLFWYNPELVYSAFMTPGLLVILVTMVGMFLTSMNIVREIEMGTIEQLNVTPITKVQFIIAKLTPFWIIGMFILAFGLGVGKLMFDFPILGNLIVLFSFAGIYLLVVLGMGLFISTITHTQQQAMLISWFFLVIFILMSGLFTSVDSMPEWAQKLTLANPVTYFVELIRMVLLKGSGFKHVTNHFIVISIMAVITNTFAVLNYKKRV